MRVLLATAIALSLWGSTSPASAQTLEWREEWNEPSLQHGILTGALGVGALVLALLADTAQPAWTRQNVVDEGVRNAVGARTPEGRRLASVFSDITRALVILPPLTIDPLMAVVRHNNNDYGLRLGLVSSFSMASAAFSLTLLKYFVRRERPTGRECALGTSTDCGARRYRSLPSGHTAMAFAGASLSCVYHPRMALYRSRGAGIAACASAMTVATLTGVLRLIAQKHYLADVVIGALLGVVAGWLLPTALYFGFDR